MASKRLEKYRKKNHEVNNNYPENPFLIIDEAKLPAKTPQDFIREWSKCICDRPKTSIVCSNQCCRFRAFGRVRRLCRAHPKVTYLLDLAECPVCCHRLYELSHE